MKSKLDHEINNNRFDDYYTVMSGVFGCQGMDYQKLEDSIFDYVSQNINDLKNQPILDIGIGDGASIKKFLEAGCEKVTGIDLNKTMLKTAKKKFGNRVRLIEANAVSMNMFRPDDFPVIISGACIHNIPRKERPAFWSEIVRLNPRLFVMIEKVMNHDEETYQIKYESQIKAFDYVLREKGGREDLAQEWIEHLKSDEPEKIDMEEIKNNLLGKYEVEIIFEMGVFKTVACKKLS